MQLVRKQMVQSLMYAVFLSFLHGNCMDKGILFGNAVRVVAMSC